jgi:hypothetical protein
MSNPPAEHFSLSWPWAVVFIALQLPLAAMSTMIALTGSVAAGIAYLVMAALYAWLPMWATHVTVSSEGLNVYRSLYRIAWSDVVGAKRSSFLGWRYVRVQRNKRVPVWLPLYLVSDRRLGAALRDWVPRGNPIENCL